MNPPDLYRSALWTAWTDTKSPRLTEIPVRADELRSRVTGDSFDGGRTAAWLSGLGPRAIWRAVRDEATGNEIHVVSDRPLNADLRLGLRLLAWASRGRPAVTWFWWDQPWIRRLPAHVDPGRDHVNGGWATPGVPEVHVYRREEAHKVLLHETIHALGLDVPAASVNPVRARFETAFGRRLWPHLGEAFTELFAEWLWSIASARSLADAEARWSAQVACSTKQAAQVWARIHDATVDENTNIFAYYVLKWVLMQHLTEALMGPDHSVRHWFRWWQEMRPVLEEKAKIESGSEVHELPMGMTCGA